MHQISPNELYVNCTHDFRHEAFRRSHGTVILLLINIFSMLKS